MAVQLMETWRTFHLMTRIGVTVWRSSVGYSELVHHKQRFATTYLIAPLMCHLDCCAVHQFH